MHQTCEPPQVGRTIGSSIQNNNCFLIWNGLSVANPSDQGRVTLCPSLFIIIACSWKYPASFKTKPMETSMSPRLNRRCASSSSSSSNLISSNMRLMKQLCIGCFSSMVSSMVYRLVRSYLIGYTLV